MRRFCTALFATLTLCATAAHAQTDNWPQRTVRLIVPYSPGGTTDYAARQIAQALSMQTGKTFYVENKAGASGTIGSDMVAKAAPDGSTFLVNDTTYAMLPHLFKKLPWDHANGLVPVTNIVDTPLVVLVGAGSPYRTIKDLVDAARRTPDKLTFGSGGVGSSTHLGGELLKQHGQLALTHVPYKGAGEALLGVVSGQVDVLVTASPTAIAQIKGGKVRALLVTAAQRLPVLADTPTSAEAGMKNFTATNWFGVAAPKGTPPAIIDKMQAEVKRALRSPELKARFEEQGATVGGMSPSEFQAFVRSQTQEWGRVVKAAGVQPD
ncbi:tripartite-type tricarboxylate transporter receptor subunit TctC [Variovorax boronicumulans]|uniref:Tripartite-type tricarboxylate transporter receptor subunit TctC n=1 Tax=Variovorax boronicumulans TaxID=436515 RepID=A0AAW8DUV2_9BURK|nr:tripartite tricarboxylate transporter substrate binding protein [Variovorax boronicumulans]MDP9877896.1 tripartite-type tricarboxylate transporter receptor subunit TctC [Variovorax boronicumulans]MDP9923180.1 tripartite-type tricarboxylate transporter receptor subunit TctC [Variovorax boronicumulans]